VAANFAFRYLKACLVRRPQPRAYINIILHRRIRQPPKPHSPTLVESGRFLFHLVGARHASPGIAIAYFIAGQACLAPTKWIIMDDSEGVGLDRSVCVLTIGGVSAFILRFILLMLFVDRGV